MSEQKTNASASGTDNFILDMMNDSNGGAQVHEKVFQGKEKIQTYDDILQKMKEGGDSQNFVEVLKNAKLADVGDFTKSYQESLSTVIGAILSSTDTMGGVFDDLRKYNEIEQGLKDEGARLVEEVTTKLAETKEWGDWRNIFFGWKDRRIATCKEDLTAAQNKQAELDKKAKMLFEDRLRNAGIEELLANFRVMTQKGVEMLNEMANTSAEQYKEIDTRHKLAEQLVQKTSVEKNRLYEELQQKKTNLDTESKNLVNFVNGTPDYDTQRAKIDTAQQEYDSTKSKFEQIEAAHNSKEKFLVILQANMTALKVVESNLRSLAVKLKSDNEERQYTYSNTIHLIQTANLQETGSAIETIGSKTDQKNLEEVLKIASASDADALARLERHPHDMKNVFEVFTAFAKMQTTNKKRLDDFMEGLKKGYMGEDNGNGGGGHSNGNVTSPSSGGTTADVVENLMKV